MLAARGIIGEDDRDALLAGLDAVRQELEAGRFPFAPDDEDIHMAIERRLTEIVGPLGGQLHPPRSRNDPGATPVPVFTRAPPPPPAPAAGPPPRAPLRGAR